LDKNCYNFVSYGHYLVNISMKMVLQQHMQNDLCIVTCKYSLRIDLLVFVFWVECIITVSWLWV